jgi:hypothetical protein
MDTIVARRVRGNKGRRSSWWIYGLLWLTALLGNAWGQDCLPPPPGLQAWWPGDDTAADISGNRHHATLLQGAQAGIEGHVGGAFQFDGIAAVATTPVLLSSHGTLAFWVNPASLDATQGLLGTVGLANGADRLSIVVTGPGGGPGVGPNRLAINLGSAIVNDIDIANPLSVGTWTHLALTFDYDADRFFLYVDGQAVALSTVARLEPTQALHIGGVTSDFGQAFFVEGRLDEVIVYDRVLSAAEIAAIATAGSGGTCRDQADVDGDGVLADACPTSLLSASVLLGSCDSHVVNPIFPSGCTLADLVADCTDGARQLRHVVQCVTRLTRPLARHGILTDEQAAAIMACADEAHRPSRNAARM